MLIHSNATISISRFTENVSWARTRTNVKTLYPVYINSRSESIQVGMDNQWAYKEFMMMTDWTFVIQIWDKIIFWTKSFVVKWGEIFDDLTWKHGEYILNEVYE